MKRTTVLKVLVTALRASIVLIAAAIAFGGPRPIAPMVSINDPFGQADYSNVPPLQRYAAGDGASLAYRRYAPAAGAERSSVVLVRSLGFLRQPNLRVRLSS